jgi:hypothetical protein
MCSNVARRGGEYQSVNVETVVVLFVIAVVLGPVGVVVIDTIKNMQEVEAKGCPITSKGVNASQGRCFRS